MIRKLATPLAGLVGFMLTALALVVSNIEAPPNAVLTHAEIRIIR